MHQDKLETVTAALDGWPLLKTLPKELYGFELQILKQEEGDRFDIFRYELSDAHKSVTAYYHEETNEYKLRLRAGYIEFCRIECITADLAAFQEMLEKQVPTILRSLVEFRRTDLGSLILKTGICDWDFGKTLPETLEGYTLFVRPTEPFKITNGSYIVIDYADFAHGCDVTIYYNVYRNEFWGEARIHAIPDVTYEFDAKTLDELQKRLEERLVLRMRGARARADEETVKRAAKAAGRKAQA